MFRKKGKPDSFGINGPNCEIEYLKKMILGMDRAFEAFALKTIKRIEALEKSSEEDVIKDAGRVTKPINCYNCRFWGTTDGEEERYNEGINGTKRCDKAIQMWDASEWKYDDKDDYIRSAIPGFEDQLMFVKDGSDYRADLYTKAEFFCAHHEPRK